MITHVSFGSVEGRTGGWQGRVVGYLSLGWNLLERKVCVAVRDDRFWKAKAALVGAFLACKREGHPF